MHLVRFNIQVRTAERVGSNYSDIDYPEKAGGVTPVLAQNQMHKYLRWWVDNFSTRDVASFSPTTSRKVTTMSW